MGLFGWFSSRGNDAAVDTGVAPNVQAMAGEYGVFSGLNDPAFYEFIKHGSGAQTEAGVSVSVQSALKNTTVLRCVSLISFAIGTLPLHLLNRETKEKAKDHPLFRVLHRKPNNWQTAFEFRTLMQHRALLHGDAYALIVRGIRQPVQQLVPLASDKVTVRQNADWSLTYRYQRPDGGVVEYQQKDILHIRFGLSDDGINGLSLVKQSAEAIGLALQAEKAAARLFRQGMMVGGALKTDGKLSPEAREHLSASMEARESAENAHRWFVLEEGLEAVPFAQSAVDSQHIEMRRNQVEEIARPYGVPRPLLVVDDTNWGSGMEVLGQFFVRYGLNPWFEAWEQSISRSLLGDDEQDEFEPKFNAGALLHGSMKDQADFFAKGLGSGGHQPWLHPQEVREFTDLPERDDLPAPMGKNKDTGANDASQTT